MSAFKPRTSFGNFLTSSLGLKLLGSPISSSSDLGFSTSQNASLPNSSLDVINSITDENLRNEYLFNYYGVKDQQNFAERMARNSYQYAVEDLRKAGLNPYLFYANGGSGATTPSTSAYGASPYASTKYSADKAYDSSIYASDKHYKAMVHSALIGLVGSLAQSASRLIPNRSQSMSITKILK